MNYVMEYINVKRKKNRLRKLTCNFVVHSNENARKKVDTLSWKSQILKKDVHKLITYVGPGMVVPYFFSVNSMFQLSPQ